MSCPSRSSCIAVGEYRTSTTWRTLAESWDGSNWSLTPTETLFGAQLSGVACPTPSYCIAVGSARDGRYLLKPIAERWDGHAWHLMTPVRLGGFSFLTSISCTSVTFCVAVGAGIGDSTLAERWDGARWTRLPVRSPSIDGTILKGVSCTGPTFCMAVGIFASGNAALTNRTLALQWDGQRWSADKAGSWVSPMAAVSCPSTTFCLAVGTSDPSTSPVAATWDGTSWKWGSAFDPGSPAPLTAVSCPSVTSCIATGEVIGRGQGPSLALQFNNGTWTRLTTSDPDAYGVLSGVSCLTISHCVGVGRSSAHGGWPFRTLAEEYSSLLLDATAAATAP